MDIYPVKDSSLPDEIRKKLAKILGEKSITKILVIGVGGCGGNLVNGLIKSGVTNIDYLLINTDINAIGDIFELNPDVPNINFIMLGEGDGAGGNPEVARELAEQQKEEILSAISKYGIVFDLAGLGKGTGTGASVYVADLSKKQDKLTIAVAIERAIREGNTEVVKKTVEALSKAADCVMPYSNDTLDELYGKLPTEEVEEYNNKPIIDSILTFTEIIHNGPNTTQKADTKDIIHIIKDSRYSIIDRQKGEGETPHLDALDKILNNPLSRNRRIKKNSRIILHFKYGSKFPYIYRSEIMARLQEKVGKLEHITPVVTILSDSDEYWVSIIAPAELIDENNIKEVKEQKEKIGIINVINENDKKQKNMITYSSKLPNREIQEQHNPNSIFYKVNDNKIDNHSKEILTNDILIDSPDEDTKPIIKDFTNTPTYIGTQTNTKVSPFINSMNNINRYNI